MTNFASWLQSMIDAKGWDQHDAALACGVRESAVHNWLHKGYIPQTKSIIKIAIALDVPVDEVMRQAQIDIPARRTADVLVKETESILLSHPEYQEIIRLINKKPPEQRETYLTLIKRLLVD